MVGCLYANGKGADPAAMTHTATPRSSRPRPNLEAGWDQALPLMPIVLAQHRQVKGSHQTVAVVIARGVGTPVTLAEH